MLRLQYFLHRSNRDRHNPRSVILCIVFFGLGFALAFSSVDIPPIIFIHETGHYLTAEALDVRLEKTDRNSYLMYLEKDSPLRKYVRVLRSGYKAELALWYLSVPVLFLINVRRVRHWRDGVHFPLALFPGYAVGLFSGMKGTTDIQVISELVHKSEQQIIQRFIIFEAIIIFTLLAAYIAGFLLFLKYREGTRIRN